jgi:hypothetical protein
MQIVLMLIRAMFKVFRTNAPVTNPHLAKQPNLVAKVHAVSGRSVGLNAEPMIKAIGRSDEF